MRILLDRDLTKELVGDAQINPASADLHTHLPGEKLRLEPGQSTLLSTVEEVDFSAGLHCGLLTLRTSSFRKGLALAAPGWVDPGYKGTLTFRVTNVSDQPVEISKMDRLVQIIVFGLDEKPDALYQGRYQGSAGTVGFIPEDPAP